MKRSNLLLWAILILFAGLVLWFLSTGKMDSLAGRFIDDIWSSIENIVRPIFRR